jgi:hypothetical protein
MPPCDSRRVVKMTLAEWFTEGARRFGENRMKWEFVCPACGFVQSTEVYKDQGAPVSAVAFSCVGRWSGATREAFGDIGPGPCNYAGDGLFRIAPIEVDGRPTFDFAEERNAPGP